MRVSWYFKAHCNCRNPGSNQGPLDLQSNALPTELSRLIVLQIKICTVAELPQNYLNDPVSNQGPLDLLKFCSVSVQPMNYNGRMLSPAKNWVLTILLLKGR